MKYKAAHLYSNIQAPEYASRKFILPIDWRFTCEINPKAIAVQDNNTDIPCFGNIENILKRDLPQCHGLDLAIAGTPCQSFSVAGKEEGMSGSSGEITNFFAFLRNYQPKSFIWENVARVIHPTNERLFRAIVYAFTGGFDVQSSPVAEWDELPPEIMTKKRRAGLPFSSGIGAGYATAHTKDGYNVAWITIDSLFISPQHRERVYMVGFKNRIKVHPWDMLKRLQGMYERERDLAGTVGLSDRYPLMRRGRGNRADFLNFETMLEDREDHAPLTNAVLRGVGAKSKNRNSNDPAIRFIAETCAMMAKEGINEKRIVQPEWEFSLNKRLGIQNGFKIVFDEASRSLNGYYKSSRKSLLQTPCLTVGSADNAGGSKPLSMLYVEDGMLKGRRLSIIETERLMGFPDNWTKARWKYKMLTDSQRRKLIGNSMDIASVGLVLRTWIQIMKVHNV